MYFCNPKSVLVGVKLLAFNVVEQHKM